MPWQKRTFITTHNNVKDDENTYTLHDIIIPAGRTAKLIRVPDPYSQDFRVSEVCDKLKFIEGSPIIILAGAYTQRAGKVLAGIARAAFRAGATIIDSGVGSGIEKFCMRKDVPLVGVCPEKEIAYPKINPTKRDDNELTNGHTHFFLTGNEDKPMSWGDEAKFKSDLAQRLAKGRSKYDKGINCKILTIVMGDNPGCIEDIMQARDNCYPVIFVQGSPMSNDVIHAKGGFP